jgi:hypothetical protein
MSETENLPDRKVAIPLGIGIFLMPYIFSWFTLRKGYSRTARAISLAWLSFLPALALGGTILEAVDPEGVKRRAEEAEQSRLAEKAERQSAELAEEAEQKIAKAESDFENSDWKRIEEIDEITDKKTIRYELGYPKIIINCEDRDAILRIDIKDEPLEGTRFLTLQKMVGNYTSDLPVEVLIRLDREAPITQEWSINVKSKYLKSSGFEDYSVKMLGKSKMAVRVPSLSAATHTYDISGFDYIYKKMTNECS